MSLSSRSVLVSLALGMVTLGLLWGCAADEEVVAPTAPVGTKKRGAECKGGECIKGLSCAPRCVSPLSCTSTGTCVDACDKAADCGDTCCSQFAGNTRGACVDKTTALGAGGTYTCK